MRLPSGQWPIAPRPNNGPQGTGTVDLPDGCGLAPGESPGTFLLTSGRGGVLHVEPREDRSTPIASSFVTQARRDNHLAVGRFVAILP
jgi:hypothetical protein